MHMHMHRSRRRRPGLLWVHAAAAGVISSVTSFKGIGADDPRPETTLFDRQITSQSLLSTNSGALDRRQSP
jgi:hypothetical protein